jgi:hypothetical protein
MSVQQKFITKKAEKALMLFGFGFDTSEPSMKVLPFTTITIRNIDFR